MEKAIASLLIMSGDDNPELVKTYSLNVVVTFSIKKDTSFDISEESERELRSLERRYGLNLHRTWRTRLPKDLLIVLFCFHRLTSRSMQLLQGEMVRQMQDIRRIPSFLGSMRRVAIPTELMPRLVLVLHLPYFQIHMELTSRTTFLVTIWVPLCQSLLLAAT